MAEVSWCGHSYVVVREQSNNITIAIDPHDGLSIGIPTCRVKADIILVTHPHYDHNAVEVARKPDSYILQLEKGERKILGVEIEGEVYYHDKSRGSLRGLTAAYCITLDNNRICHLGDIGHIPEVESLTWMKRADLVFIPVGGVYTIDSHEAWTLIGLLEPKLVIPIHYWIPGSLLPLDPLDRFLNIAKTQRLRLTSNKIEIPLEKQPEKTVIAIPQL